MLARPSTAQVRSYLEAQKDKSFSYREVGASAGTPPANYVVDHNRVQLGYGLPVYNLAIEAVVAWKMFDFDWLQLSWPDAPITEGSVVAVIANHFGFWSINSCRIIYTVDEKEGTTHSFGFAYGTLPDHAERGEERFLVEWNQADDSVWYDLLAFSRPNEVLAKLGYPVTRYLQRKFARDSKSAMVRATSCM